MWQALKQTLIAAVLLAASLPTLAGPPRGAFTLPVFVYSNAVSSVTPASAATGVVRAAASQIDLLPVTGVAYAECHLRIATSTWFNTGQLQWNIHLSQDAPTNLQVLVFLKDWDYLWFQRLLPGFLKPGDNPSRVDLSPSASDWQPRDHEAVWNARTLMEPKAIGIRVFGTEASFTARVEDVRASLLPPPAEPPIIRHVIPNRNQVSCFDRFELTFDLPDRYANPFNPDEIAVDALIVTPQGRTNKVAGFFTQNFYRQTRPSGESIVPQGPPRWKLRYAPPTPGEYRYTLTARDAAGVTTWGPGVFRAVPGRNNGYVRVSRRDPRYFEFNEEVPFNPIGHNIRSPNDTRMNGQFPWARRWDAGTGIYEHYFRDMQAHGENLAEVWMAAWSLGLEWSEEWPGYHNVGQYNIRNAWEMDRVIENAERRGILLNVVIHNHGKYSEMVDAEWRHNPMNVVNGGPLAKADLFFTDPWAKKQFRNLMRYTVARWGYSTSVFAWELWSELNLAGSSRDTYQKQEVVDWHQFAATAIRSMDLERHLITTHYSNDYGTQNTNITALAEISHASVDAYYTTANHLAIVSLLSRTAEFNNRFMKPVMATEFGGAWNAQGLPHLLNCLHAGLWASTAVPVAGTPLFWWWGLIDERNLYPKYKAISRFMQGEDRRDPAMLPASPRLSRNASNIESLMLVCLQSEVRANGWIYAPSQFTDDPPSETNCFQDILLEIEGITAGTYRAEFWDTTVGEVIQQITINSSTGCLTVPIPPFRRDIAFKVRFVP